LAGARWHFETKVVDEEDGRVGFDELALEVGPLIELECEFRAFLPDLVAGLDGGVFVAAVGTLERLEDNLSEEWDLEEKQFRDALRFQIS
jgi:hypothetical protein